MKPLNPVSEEVRLQAGSETSSMTSADDGGQDQVQSHLGERVTINVGGKKLQPFVSTLKNVPDSPLAWILQDGCKTKLDYDDDCKEYFFDRHPGVFCQVLNYFQTGKLHCPRDVCGPMFEEELRFWGIEEQQMESCCWSKYTQHRETQEHLKMFTFHNHQQPSNAVAPHGVDEINQTSTGWKRFQKNLWEVLDEPYSSNAAKIYSWVSLSFIVLSVISYIVYTWQLAEKKKHCGTDETTKTNLSSNSSQQAPSNDDCAGNIAKTLIITYFVEVICTGWFSLEIILRFLFCPSKSKYMRHLSNWVDVIAVIPVYLLLFQRESQLITILNLIRYVRVFRFFKLLYALHILGKTIQASAYQLLTLLIVLMFPVVLFSSFLFYADKHFAPKPLGLKGLSNIPDGFWWSVVTMTTVGYGDKVPKSILGQLVGGAAAICGVILLSLTTSILGSTFQQYYTVAQTQLKIPQGCRRKIKVSKTTLVALTKGVNQYEKSSSIKSGDSKTSERDSGYGRSPEQSRQRREPLNSCLVSRRSIRGSMLV